MPCLHITCHIARRLELANSFEPFSRLSRQVASKRTNAILPDLLHKLHYFFTMYDMRSRLLPRCLSHWHPVTVCEVPALFNLTNIPEFL